MEPGDLEVASMFCRLVQTADLFEYVGLAPDAPLTEAVDALSKKRRRMQSMQANPKFKESATFLIKNYRRLERVLAEPQAHLAAMRLEREEEHVPMLMLALEGVLADGRVTAAEEAFLRQATLHLGISEERYAAVLAEALSARGIVLESPGVSPEAQTTARLRGAEGHGWWDATFTRLLLECIPGGPGDLVDLYCRTGLSAATVLPERPQLSWTGIDRSRERLDAAGAALASRGDGTLSRITLRQGSPSAVPLEAGSMDYALVIRALANLSDTRPVFGEAWRILREGGRVIVVEPDGLMEAFYFGDNLARYNTAFRTLCLEVDARLGIGVDPMGRPGLALGPQLPSRLAAAGFTPGPARVHASNTLEPVAFGHLARRLRRYPQALARAAGLEDSPRVAAVLAEVDALEAAIGPGQVALGGHVLPLFLATGDKEVAR
ncbi:MAG TPA: methyltransferase domain-containing protein [Deltaproteobacteria bacterium]|nr:methyltransferase domain-containing protein [Deltaproteobacteria bacterium]